MGKGQKWAGDIALGGILVALSLLFLALASAGAARSANIYAAALLPMPLLLRGRKGMAWSLWCASLLLGFLVLPQKDICLAYGFFGYYLMLREEIRSRVRRWLSLLLQTAWLCASAGLFLLLWQGISGLRFADLLAGTEFSMGIVTCISVICAFLAVCFSDWAVERIAEYGKAHLR